MCSVRNLCACLLSLALLSAAGCDNRPARVPVSGVVLINGQPLRAGHIRVIPGDAKAATSDVGPNGEFTLTTFDQGDGCVLGTHDVEVIGRDTTERGIVWLAPQKFSRVETSGVTVTIDGARSDVEIRLVEEGFTPEVDEATTAGDGDPTAQ